MLMLAVAGGVVGITLVLLLYRPPMPASWSQLRTGMTQKEVEDLVGWEAVWRRDRGVHLQHGAPMFGAGGVWELDLTYDGYAMSSVRYGGGRYGNARLKRATATYYHQFRLLGSQPIELP